MVDDQRCKTHKIQRLLQVLFGGTLFRKLSLKYTGTASENPLKADEKTCFVNFLFKETEF